MLRFPNILRQGNEYCVALLNGRHSNWKGCQLVLIEK